MGYALLVVFSNVFYLWERQQNPLNSLHQCPNAWAHFLRVPPPLFSPLNRKRMSMKPIHSRRAAKNKAARPHLGRRISLRRSAVGALQVQLGQVGCRCRALCRVRLLADVLQYVVPASDPLPPHHDRFMNINTPHGRDSPFARPSLPRAEHT